jgi:hypothetical protein
LFYTKNVVPKTSHEVPKAQKGGNDFLVVLGDPHEHHGNPSLQLEPTNYYQHYLIVLIEPTNYL